MTSLDQCLENENKNTILQKTKVLGCSSSSSMRKDEVSILYKNFINENTQIIWEQLDEISQLLIAEMSYNSGNYYDHTKFTSKYNRYPKFKTSNREETLLGGLFFTRDHIFPEEFKKLFKPLVKEPKQYILPTSTSLPNDIRNRETVLSSFKELHDILYLLKQKPFKVSDKTNMPTVTTIGLINKLFKHGDYYQGMEILYDKVGDIRAIGWIMLLQAGKLVKKTGSNLEITPKGKKALKEPPQNIMKALWKSWVTNKLLDEFKRIHNIKGQTSKAMKRGFTNPVHRREIVEDILKTLPTNTWIETKDISKYVLLNDLGFEVTNTNGWGLYIVDSQYGQIGEYYNTWHILEEPYLLCLLFEYAATLGMIDIGFVSPVDQRMDLYSQSWGADELSLISRYDGLTHIRITELGEYILGIKPQFTMKLPETTITFSKDSVISVETLLMPIDIKETLGSFAEKISEYQWKLTESSITKALQSGYKLSSLKSLFKNYNSPLPETLLKLLDQFNKKSNKLKFKDTLFLYECDPDFADSIMINKHISYAMRAGEGMIAIPAKQKEKFKDEMLKQQVII